MKAHSVILIHLIFWMTLIPSILLADPGQWYDTFYQYRIPVEAEVEKPGWVIIPLDEKTITTAINEIEEFHYNPVRYKNS